MTDGLVIRLAPPPPPVVNERLVAMLRDLLAMAERGELVAFIGAIGFADRCFGRALSWPEAPYNLVTLLGELQLAERRLCEVIEQRE